MMMMVHELATNKNDFSVRACGRKSYFSLNVYIIFLPNWLMYHQIVVEDDEKYED